MAKPPYPELQYYTQYTPTDPPLLFSRTSVHVWVSEQPDTWHSVQDEAEYLAKIHAIENSRTSDGNSYTIIAARPNRSATGDTTTPWIPVTLSSEALAKTVSLLSDRNEAQSFLQSRHPHFSSEIHYGKASDKPECLVVCFRCPRQSRFLLGIMRIDLRTLSATVFVSHSSSDEAQRFRKDCTDHSDLLQLHPLYLIILVFEERYRVWSQWFVSLWVKLIEVEGTTTMTSGEWVARRRLRPVARLQDTGNLLKRTQEIHTELSHCENVMKFGRKFAAGGMEAMEKCERERSALVGKTLKKGQRMGWERRLRSAAAKLDSMEDRMVELKQRLQGQVNVAFSLIAQEDSKASMTIAARSAADGRIMRTIALLTLLFLPSTLVTSIWDANIFELEPSKSWKVWLGTVVSVTTMVIAFWVGYERRAVQRGY